MAFSNSQVAPAGATPGGCPERVRTASSCSGPQGWLPPSGFKKNKIGYLSFIKIEGDRVTNYDYSLKSDMPDYKKNTKTHRLPQARLRV
jgi:hypothetical protein